jgi:uncharacterized protein YndB with AHSA1/START domain
VDAIIEPRVGGRWYERGDDGSTCEWGSVLSWEPPSRLILSWDIGADWQYAPNLKTEIEVRFIAEGKDSTQRQIRGLLWKQGILRHSHEEIVGAALRDWRAVLAVMSGGPFFFGDEATGVDAIVFGTLATTVLTPIESPIRDFLRSQPGCLAYAERMRERFFPELVLTPQDDQSESRRSSLAAPSGKPAAFHSGKPSSSRRMS